METTSRVESASETRLCNTCANTSSSTNVMPTPHLQQQKKKKKTPKDAFALKCIVQCVTVKEKLTPTLVLQSAEVQKLCQRVSVLKTTTTREAGVSRKRQFLLADSDDAASAQCISAQFAAVTGKCTPTLVLPHARRHRTSR